MDARTLGLIGALAGCSGGGTATDTATPTPTPTPDPTPEPTPTPPDVVPPTAEELAACEQQIFGESGFDWDCCDVWYRQCIVEGRDPEDDRAWICNG
jgi:hypothetical protein